jgi:two-component system chemotaxis response regulator CheY
MIKKILVVDDSRAARFGMCAILSKIGQFEVHEAGDGKAGVAKYNEVRPDVTFMDLTMPLMDGIQALIEIKKAHPEAVVIVLSADIQKSTVERVMSNGAMTFLSKPPVKDVIEGVLAEAEKILGVPAGK